MRAGPKGHGPGASKHYLQTTDTMCDSRNTAVVLMVNSPTPLLLHENNLNQLS